MGLLLFVMLVLVFIYFLLRYWNYIDSPMKHYKTSVNKITQHHNGTDYIISWKNGMEFVGSGTIWYHLANGKRCDSSLESELADLLTAHIRWKDTSKEEKPKKR